MSGQPLSKFSNAFGQSSVVMADLFNRLAQPVPARRLRYILAGLALIWIVLACARLIWALYPSSEAVLPADIVILNPAEKAASSQPMESIDLDKMLSWHLLGKADEIIAAPAGGERQREQPTGREGIEEGARETRLDLRLRGIVASTVDGLGHAIIENKSKQQVYAVGDKLPVSGRIVVAKVMPDKVVIDNRGTYELLTLFEETSLSTQVPVARVKKPDSREKGNRAIDKRGDPNTTALAQSYRQKLYQNPQSMADLVRISAVRNEDVLLGYRVSPGSDAAQFKQLGFQKGDLVTGVNGIALDDPGNSVRLYQLMRSAGEAVFDLQRDGEALTISVSLDDTGVER